MSRKVSEQEVTLLRLKGIEMKLESSDVYKNIAIVNVLSLVKVAITQLFDMIQKDR